MDRLYLKRRKNSVHLNILGGDLSENSLNDAKTLFGFFDVKIPLYKFNLINLPFPDKSFDNVICSSVLEHIPNMTLLYKAINESRRVLRPQGILIINIPNGFGSYCLISDRIMRKFGILRGKNIDKSIEHYHYHLYSFKKWMNIVERNGFYFIDAANQWFTFNYFNLILGILHIRDKSIKYHLSIIDQKITDHIPHILSSSWAMAFKQSTISKRNKDEE